MPTNRERTFSWQDPMIGAKAGQTMSGLENPPISAGSGHAMNGCSESISEKPVIHPHENRADR
jgi:hypothetical protein